MVTEEEETQDSSMTRKAISYFNKEHKFYESLKLVENQSNQDIIGSCERYVKMCPINEANTLVGKAIFIIGEFHDEDVDNPLVSYQEPVLCVDCDLILKARFPQIYEQGIERINPENN